MAANKALLWVTAFSAGALLLAGCGYTSDSVASSGSAAKSEVRDAVAPNRPAFTGSWVYQDVAIAGTGDDGFSGDSGAATKAQLGQPHAFVNGPNGTMYIADTWNNRIRMVDDEGNITTIAGDGSTCSGTISTNSCGDGDIATKAQLNQPSGLALNHDNSALIVADTNANRIRQIDLKTDKITTIAGTGEMDFAGDGGLAGSAALARPLDVIFDSTGDLIIADTDNNRIRKIDSKGMISTIAGQRSSCSPDSDCGVGKPATAAKLATPSGLAWLPADDGGGPTLLVADTNSHTIRSINNQGIFGTLLGTGAPGKSPDDSTLASLQLSAPRRIDASLPGIVVVSDTGNNRIVVADFPADQAWQANSSKTTINEPWDVQSASSGFIYADAGTAAIRSLTSPTGPTFTWDKCGPDSYAHVGNAQRYSDVLVTLPGTNSVQIQAWGGAGGASEPYAPDQQEENWPGGAGGYAQTTAPARSSGDDYFAVAVGCKGADAFQAPHDANGGSGGGGGSSVVAPWSAFTTDDPHGVLVVAGGGGGRGAKCFEATQQPWHCMQSRPLDQGNPGANGSSNATTPTAPGGPGGDGRELGHGGWGVNWCSPNNTTCESDVEAGHGSAGSPSDDGAEGGGGGGGAAGGHGGFNTGNSGSGGQGGGSWSSCNDTTETQTPSTTNGKIVITPHATTPPVTC